MIWRKEINISFKCNFVGFLVIGNALELVLCWGSCLEIVLGGFYLRVLSVQWRDVDCTFVTAVELSTLELFLQ